MRYICVCLLCFGAASAQAAQPAADALFLAYLDARTLPPDQALYTRYLWVSDPDPKLRQQTWAACAGQINFLSYSQRIVSPLLILDNGTVKTWQDMRPNDWAGLVLLRVNLLHYKQGPGQWDKLGDPSLEPIFHVWTYNKEEEKWYRALAPWLVEPLNAGETQYGKALLELVRMTGYAKCPIIEARNFIWQTAIQFDRPAGYYTWLGIKDKKSFDRLVRADFDATRLRDAITKSGVAAMEVRVVDRFGRGDGYWITYDQVNQRGIGDRNPLNQVDPDKFLFDASEVFGRLDNGLWAFGLFNNKGVRQDSAPDGVGYNHNTATNDGKIHICLTCLSCHDSVAGRGGLQPFSPYFRNLYAEPGPVALGAVQAKSLASFEDLYLTPFDSFADVDRRIYAAALFQANGLEPHTYAAALADTFLSWDRHLTLQAAAWEHGVVEEDFVLGLQAQMLKFGILDNTNANWILPKERRARIGRDQFAESYNQAELALRGLPQWSPETKAKLRPWAK